MSYWEGAVLLSASAVGALSDYFLLLLSNCWSQHRILSLEEYYVSDILRPSIQKLF